MPVASSYAGAAAAVEPRRRSLSAERAIQNRNRYSTARKPNLSATATGSSATLLLQLERDAGGAELDRVAGAQRLRALDSVAVDLDPVGRAEVADDPRAPRRAQLGVAARDVRILEHDVGVARAAEHRALRVQDLGPAVHAQAGAAAAEVWLPQRLGQPVGRRVDHRVAVVTLARRLLGA